MILDNIVQPVVYQLEKLVVRGMIPDVSSVPGRQQLANFREDVGSRTCNHGLWDRILKDYVSVGSVDGHDSIHLVDYDRLVELQQSKKSNAFADYLKVLETTDPQKLRPSEQLAFWMNAYNALCINLIVQHEAKTGQKLSSINELSNIPVTDENGESKKVTVWDQVAGVVNGQEITLNQIEHDKIRGQWAEPGIHACIVCASASCPNLRQEAFIGDSLEQQMQNQVEQWMKHPTKGLVREGDRRVRMSRIFLWFEKDFATAGAGPKSMLQDWLPPYVVDSNEFRDDLKGGKFGSPRYFTYSWAINRLNNEQTPTADLN